MQKYDKFVSQIDIWFFPEVETGGILEINLNRKLVERLLVNDMKGFSLKRFLEFRGVHYTEPKVTWETHKVLGRVQKGKV